MLNIARVILLVVSIAILSIAASALNESLVVRSWPTVDGYRAVNETERYGRYYYTVGNDIYWGSQVTTLDVRVFCSWCTPAKLPKHEPFKVFYDSRSPGTAFLSTKFPLGSLAFLVIVGAPLLGIAVLWNKSLNFLRRVLGSDQYIPSGDI
jgi:hypothetical protein